ncbi:type II toxin-antitoxin system VapC family toxin [Candidatus Woesearchaeota archaeon]|nr:type II toxin-antitoxin system VapC family toxin [Candidatus Woesearchaeota archaeon]
MMYLDANFFIYCHFDQGSRGKAAREILRKIVGGMQTVTSVLALDEVMWVIIKKNVSGEMRSAIERIYATPNIRIVHVGADIPLLALDLMEAHNLKPRDAFHASVMKSLGITEIVSDDSDFDKVSWIKRIALIT